MKRTVRLAFLGFFCLCSGIAGFVVHSFWFAGSCLAIMAILLVRELPPDW